MPGKDEKITSHNLTLGIISRPYPNGNGCLVKALSNLYLIVITYPWQKFNAGTIN